MAENNRTFLKLPTSPLSRRIVFWVFISVIVIETIILIPSLENRKQELLAHLREVSLARISVLLLSDLVDAADAGRAAGQEAEAEEKAAHRRGIAELAEDAARARDALERRCAALDAAAEDVAKGEIAAWSGARTLVVPDGGPAAPESREGPDAGAEEAEEGSALLDRLRLLARYPEILGGAVYAASGERVGHFGQAPELMPDAARKGEVMVMSVQEGDSYDVVWPAGMLAGRHALVIRHDASPVSAELYAFALRIAGLVLIISIFVTGGAWIALDPIVVSPILKLRSDLVSAGEAVRDGKRTPAFHAAFIEREDELGEVIDAFRRMYRQISDEITERRRAERSLQVSLSQVETYSGALNKELEQGRLMQKNFLPGRVSSERMTSTTGSRLLRSTPTWRAMAGNWRLRNSAQCSSITWRASAS